MNAKAVKKTGAKVPPPKRPDDEIVGLVSPEAGRLGEAPTWAPDNIVEKKWADLNFKVTKEFRTRFKTTAAANGISSVDLLKQAFDLWVKDRKSRIG